MAILMLKGKLNVIIIKPRTKLSELLLLLLLLLMLRDSFQIFASPSKYLQASQNIWLCFS